MPPGTLYFDLFVDSDTEQSPPGKAAEGQRLALPTVKPEGEQQQPKHAEQLQQQQQDKEEEDEEVHQQVQQQHQQQQQQQQVQQQQQQWQLHERQQRQGIQRLAQRRKRSAAQEAWTSDEYEGTADGSVLRHSSAAGRAKSRRRHTATAHLAASQTRIKILSDLRGWERATVVGFDPTTGLHTVQYTPDCAEELNLSVVRYEVLDSDGSIRQGHRGARTHAATAAAAAATRAMGRRSAQLAAFRLPQVPDRQVQLAALEAQLPTILAAYAATGRAVAGGVLEGKPRGFILHSSVGKVVYCPVRSLAVYGGSSARVFVLPGNIQSVCNPAGAATYTMTLRLLQPAVVALPHGPPATPVKPGNASSTHSTPLPAAAAAEGGAPEEGVAGGAGVQAAGAEAIGDAQLPGDWQVHTTVVQAHVYEAGTQLRKGTGQSEFPLCRFSHCYLLAQCAVATAQVDLYLLPPELVAAPPTAREVPCLADADVAAAAAESDTSSCSSELDGAGGGTGTGAPQQGPAQAVQPRGTTVSSGGMAKWVMPVAGDSQLRAARLPLERLQGEQQPGAGTEQVLDEERMADVAAGKGVVDQQQKERHKDKQQQLPRMQQQDQLQPQQQQEQQEQDPGQQRCVQQEERLALSPPPLLPLLQQQTGVDPPALLQQQSGARPPWLQGGSTGHLATMTSTGMPLPQRPFGPGGVHVAAAAQYSAGGPHAQVNVFAHPHAPPALPPGMPRPLWQQQQQQVQGGFQGLGARVLLMPRTGFGRGGHVLLPPECAVGSGAQATFPGLAGQGGLQPVGRAVAHRQAAAAAAAAGGGSSFTGPHHHAGNMGQVAAAAAAAAVAAAPAAAPAPPPAAAAPPPAAAAAGQAGVPAALLQPAVGAGGPPGAQLVPPAEGSGSEVEGLGEARQYIMRLMRRLQVEDGLKEQVRVKLVADDIEVQQDVVEWTCLLRTAVKEGKQHTVPKLLKDMVTNHTMLGEVDPHWIGPTVCCV